MNLIYRFLSAVKAGGFLYALRKCFVVLRRMQHSKPILASKGVDIDAPASSQSDRLLIAISSRETMPKNNFRMKGILIITACQIPQCLEYRVQRKFEHGLMSKVPVYYSDSHDVYRILSLLQVCGKVIIYRDAPEYIELIRKECDRLGVALSFEVDDLILPSDELDGSGVLLGLSDQQVGGLKEQAVAFYEVASICDSLVVSTPYLKVKLEPYFNVPIIVLPNVVRGDTTFIDAVSVEVRPRVVAYTSPSKSVTQDVELIVSDLSGFLDNNSDWSVALFGNELVYDLLIQAGVNNNQVLLGRRLGYQEYLGELSKCEIVIIPLENNEFNKCKTMIRFLDAAVAGVSVAYSPVGEMAVLSDLQDSVGVSVYGEKTWKEALEMMSTNESLRESCVINARSWLMENRTVASQKCVFDSFLQERGC